MIFILRSFILYLAALLVGSVTLMFVVPFLAIDLFGRFMPLRIDINMAFIFGHYCIIRGWLLWVSAAIAAGVGFFVKDRALRYAMLTLPIWAPLCYVIFYMVLVAG